MGRARPGKRGVTAVVVLALAASAAADARPAQAPTLVRFPAKYRIVKSSFSTHTTASEDGHPLCGTISGSINYSGMGGAEKPNSSTTLKKSAGYVSGRIYAKPSARWTDHLLHGCKYGQNGVEPCDAHMPDMSPQPDGKDTIGIALVAKPVGSTIKVIWAIPNPFVGFVTGDDPNSWCNVSIEGDLDYSDSQQTVPLSVFDRKGPVTLSYTSSRHLTKDNLGHPADIHYDWTYSITFRRIPSHGAPPGGGCRVPKLVGKTLTAAKQALRKMHCKLGKVVQVRSRAKKDLVLAQHPLSGANLPVGSKVDLYVSRGH